ncbi:MAG: hypothetical protein AB1744_00650 [Candidatus Zixiibacteriota bacterium]
MARVRKAAKAWTATEVTTLRQMYRTQSATQIAKALRRTVSSVKAKARTLKLRKPGRRRAATKKMVTRRAVGRPKTRRATTRRKTTRKTAARKRTRRTR